MRLKYIVILILFYGISQKAFSQEDSIINAIEQSSQVFIAKAIGSGEAIFVTGKKTIIEFELSEIYKGKRLKNVIVLSEDSLNPILVKHEYLIYGKNGIYKTKKGKEKKGNYLVCNRIKDITDNKSINDLIILNKIFKGKTKKPRNAINLAPCSCGTLKF